MQTVSVQPKTLVSLSAREALEIAGGYGLPYSVFKEDILANLHRARAYHLAPRPDNLRKTARDYFEGYMADIAHEVRCEELANTWAD